MKFTLKLFAVLALFTSAAQAADCGSVCTGLTFSSDRINCLAATRDAWFEDTSCNTCGSLTFTSDKITCLTVTRNKAYTATENNICSTMTFTSDKIDCLKKSGRDVTKPNFEDCNLRSVAFKVDGAIGNLRGGQYRAALSTLENLRNLLVACGVYN